jgi:hypothetical protein
MALQIIGAGLPRTGTWSLMQALERLLRGRCYHMREIPGHPFDLGPAWRGALDGRLPEWEALFAGYAAAVDWPASLFWRELSATYPDALVLLSLRESAQVWWQSAEATILPVARESLAPDWTEGRDFLTVMARFAGTPAWDDPATLMAAYERHTAAVRAGVPADRLLEWQPRDGWAPLCARLGLPLPDEPFPWTNRREDWG